MMNNDNNNPVPVKRGRFGLIFFICMLSVFCVYMIYSSSKTTIPEITYSRFIQAVLDQQVTEVHIVGNRVIQGVMRSSNNEVSYFTTYIPYTDDTLIPLLEEKEIIVSGADFSPSIFSYLLDFAPLLIMLLFLFIILRQNAVQSARGMQFGRSRAHIYTGGKKVTFDDVAGQEEAKKELAGIIDFLKNPKKYLDMGAKIPTGVLLVGSPGTGKTLLARAVAGEAGVSFLHISGSDFVEMFVGVGASRVRDLFAQGRKMAPAIIFIDEIDAVGRARGAGLGGGHDEREQTLNQMLVEMDGFENKDGVIILAATNRPDVLDPALLRPGRFDRQVTISLPDIKEREAILNVHGKKIPLAPDVDMRKFARATPGMSGADLANIVNEAALFAAARNLKKVGCQEFEDARDKILMGVARETMVLPEKERKITAVHEAGHALPYYYLDNASPLHKVTIIPRGRALGLTVGLPEHDSYSHTRSWLSDQLVILYGGYAAETVVYGETTTGTQNDIQRATEIAHRMVCEWGMAEQTGAVCYGQEDEPIFMGRDIARRKTFSDDTARRIDVAVREILTQAEQRAFAILTEHREQLDKLAAALVERETMDDYEIRQLLNFSLPEYHEDSESMSRQIDIDFPKKTDV